ncbi:CAP domain-containing protein [Candidatus Microgenomates bacterium]|nr:MAG: CAP domain-containing protein [Candidatus Microgenomates bacterium]
MLSYLRHLFLPHHTNNYRAKVLHYDFFLVYVIIFLFGSIFIRTLHRIDPDVLGYATNITVDKLLEYTNQQRSAEGAPPLSLNEQLSQAAAGKAADMFGKDYWAHNGPEGETPWDFINGAGYAYIVAGENLAKNFNDSQSVVQAWMDSPSHRENLLRNQYADVGFAVVNGTLNGEDTTLVVQMFGKRLSSPPQIAETSSQNEQSLIPVETIQAQEIQQASGTPVIAQILPSAMPSALPVVEQQAPKLFGATSFIQTPLIDIRSVSQNALFIISTILLLTLVLDGIYVFRNKIVRVGGKFGAHLVFLFGLTTLIWLMQFGSIL